MRKEKKKRKQQRPFLFGFVARTVSHQSGRWQEIRPEFRVDGDPVCNQFIPFQLCLLVAFVALCCDVSPACVFFASVSTSSENKSLTKAKHASK